MGEVAIVGGSGFLGRHIVRELLLSEDLRQELRAVRVIDVVPFPQSFLEGLDEGGHVPIKTRLCDVAPSEVEEDVEEGEEGQDGLLTKGRRRQRLQEALEGVRAVLHCAALRPTLIRGPEDLSEGERERMHRVNVEGTKNVVAACLAVGVQVLVYTSTVAAVQGSRPIFEHTESNVPLAPDRDLLLGHYAADRRRAEEEVLRAHGTRGNNGTVLQTMALRPVVLFGEGDTSFVPPLVSLGRSAGGALPSVGRPDVFFQMAYVGNAAVAHVQALSSLLKESTASPASPPPINYCGGLPVFITDDTPLSNVQGLVRPFLAPLGVPISPWRVPYLVALLLVLVLRLLLRVTEKCRSWVGDPFRRMRGALPSPSFLCLGCSTAVYPRIRARLGIQYSPKYSWEESLRQSKAFYSRYCANPK